MIDDRVSMPWYRHPWPWLIMSIPAISAVLGITMLILATSSYDGLVAEDYYKQGMAINEVLDKEARAQRAGLHAGATVDEGRVRIMLTGDTPSALKLRLVHPTRAGEDMLLRLYPIRTGFYEAAWPEFPPGRRLAMLEDGTGTWRIKGVMNNAHAITFESGGRQ